MNDQDIHFGAGIPTVFPALTKINESYLAQLDRFALQAPPVPRWFSPIIDPKFKKECEDASAAYAAAKSDQAGIIAASARSHRAQAQSMNEWDKQIAAQWPYAYAQMVMEHRPKPHVIVPSEDHP